MPTKRQLFDDRFFEIQEGLDLTYLRQWAIEKALLYSDTAEEAIREAKQLVAYISEVESEKEPPTNGDVDNGD
jgi:hypothetical protein